MSRRILPFSIFKASITRLTPEQEEFLNKYTKGTWTYNSSTGLVDVKGHFDFSNKQLEDFVGVKFGKVSGDFDCKRNNLTRLSGAPQVVGGSFYCYDNNLTSLAGSPQKVGGGFFCDRNNLTSLAGAPQKVGVDFSCERNKLTSLEGAPQEVGGHFDCYLNNLTSLAGAPQKIGGQFESDAFVLTEGDWNLKGWLKVLQEGSPEAQKLILTLLPVEALNKEIARDPAGMTIKLKGVWNDESFKETRSKLVWPKGYSDDADLVGDLDDVGF